MSIPMGVPHFQIKDIIKDKGIAVFSGNLTLYRDISRRVFAVVAESFAKLEQYSIDEAFVILSDVTDLQQLIAQVKDNVFTQTGMPVSIGVASSKTLAKYAVDQAKQTTGCYVLTQDEWLRSAATVPLPTLWGVGRRLAEQYKTAGLFTAADLMQADQSRVAQLFGVQGTRLQAELAGEYVHLVTSKRPLQKSLMSSRSFATKTENKAILSDALAYHARHIAAQLRSMDAVAGTIRVSLQTSRHGDFLLRGGSLVTVLTEPTADTFTLISQAAQLLESLYEPAVPYQKVGVMVGEITNRLSLTTSLFPKPQTDNAALLQTIDALNKTVSGRELIVFGSRLQTKQWQSKAVARSAAYTTRWSDIARVSAS